MQQQRPILSYKEKPDLPFSAPLFPDGLQILADVLHLTDYAGRGEVPLLETLRKAQDEVCLVLGQPAAL